MTYTMVTYTVKPGREEENAALVRAVFEELAQTRATGFRYAVFQLPDSRQFVHLYTDEGAPSGTLQRLPSFQAFVAGARDRHEQAATFAEPQLIGDYRTFEQPVKAITRNRSTGPGKEWLVLPAAGNTGVQKCYGRGPQRLETRSERSRLDQLA